MEVVKRDGRREPVQFDKITARLAKLCEGLSGLVHPVLVAQKVCNSVKDGMSTTELDELSAEVAVSLSTLHPDYETLAARYPKLLNNLLILV